MRRAIRIHNIDNSFFDCELSKVTQIKDPDKTMSVMIHLDKLKNGTWQLIYNTGHITDFKMLKNLEIIREN